AYAFHFCLAAEFTLGSNFSDHACNFNGEKVQQFHHAVHFFGYASELTLKFMATDFLWHLQGKVPLRYRADDARDFVGGVHQVGYEGVQILHPCGPRSLGMWEVDTMGQLAVSAYRLTGTCDFADDRLILRNDLV